MEKRRCRSRAEIRQLVREFEASGLSASELAKANGFQAHHIKRWAKREKAARVKPTSFVVFASLALPSQHLQKRAPCC